MIFNRRNLTGFFVCFFMIVLAMASILVPKARAQYTTYRNMWPAGYQYDIYGYWDSPYNSISLHHPDLIVYGHYGAGLNYAGLYGWNMGLGYQTAGSSSNSTQSSNTYSTSNFRSTTMTNPLFGTSQSYILSGSTNFNPFLRELSTSTFLPVPTTIYINPSLSPYPNSYPAWVH
ncbi:MAG: hypothetical protein ACMUIU_08535 [bacterium]